MSAILSTIGALLAPTVVDTLGSVGKSIVSTLGSFGVQKVNQWLDKPYNKYEGRLANVEKKVDQIEQEFNTVKSKFYEK